MPVCSSTLNKQTNKNKKEPLGRKVRWVEQLSQYSFIAVHRPGRQYLSPDGLLRTLLPEAHRSHLETFADQPEQASSPAATASVDVATPVLAGLSATELAAAKAVDVDLSVVLPRYNAVSGKFVALPKVSGTSRSMRLFSANAVESEGTFGSRLMPHPAYCASPRP